MSSARKVDAGSAVVAAVFAAAAFALLANQMVRTSRSAIQSANAGFEHAQLEADAEAALAIAVNGLTATDPNRRWDIDGAPHTVDFDKAELTISIEDERGKIPLNTITEPQLRVLFRKGGAAPEEVEGLVQAFLNFRDPARAQARITASPTQVGADDRIGGFLTVEELAEVPGMTPALYAMLIPAVTATNDNAPFDPRYATPLALEVMGHDAANGPLLIERQRELAGERPTLEDADDLGLIGRALTVHVTAQTGDAQLTRLHIIELTGKSGRPYVVRRPSA